MTLNLTKKTLLYGIYLLLLVVILGLLLWSQPWKANSSSETRKITVSGQATVESEPDLYVFSPYFEVKDTDQEAARKEVSTLANNAVEAMKELGVEEKDITLDVSNYDRWYWAEGEEGVMNAYLTIKIRDKDLAQKVQDYLTSSSAKGQLTSQESFSEEKQKSLESEATEQAIEDARSKAEAQAKLFGAKLGDVIEVKQNEDVSALPYRGIAELQISDGADKSLPVLPGEQEYTKTLQVVYELR